MKKRIITLLLALTCCVPLFVGCNDTDTPDEPETSASIITGTITNWKVPTPERGSDGLYTIIVNDFERPADIGPVIAGQKNTAGEVEKKIVHSGKQSFKIRFLIEDGRYDYANIRQPLNLEHRKDYSNLKTVKKISFWVYNAQSAPKDFTFAITFVGDKSPAVEETVEIRSKEWQLVEIDMTKYTIPSKAAERLSFTFDQASPSKDTVFYIDDICLHSTTPM